MSDVVETAGGGPIVLGEDAATAEARRLVRDDRFLGDWLIGVIPDDVLHPTVLAEIRRLVREQIAEDEAHV